MGGAGDVVEVAGLLDPAGGGVGADGVGDVRAGGPGRGVLTDPSGGGVAVGGRGVSGARALLVLTLVPVADVMIEEVAPLVASRDDDARK